MKFTQHYSSSTSNLYTVESANGNRLMIECGATWKQIQKALNYRVDNVIGCLLSHSHKDHAKSIEFVLTSGITVYTSGDTLKQLGYFNHRKTFPLNTVSTGYVWHTLCDFRFMAFPTNHDDTDPRGFIVSCDNEYLLFATDTSHITQRFQVAFDIIAIECSYDRDILKERVETGDINESLAKRLLSSHMEWRNTVRYLHECCDLSRCRQIHLLHLSRDNIYDWVVKDVVDSELFIEPVTV